MIDYYLAPYVALTFAKEVASIAKFKLDLTEPVYKELKNKLVDYRKEHKLIMGDNCKAELEGILNEFFKSNGIECSDSRVHKIIEDAYAETDNETFQAMEAFIHNLNTMHCLPASEKIWVYDVESQDFKTMTMEELNNSFKPNRYKVVSLNKETGKAEFKFITHCKKMDNNRKLIKLTDSQGRTVRVTDNHRIMTMDGIKITEDIPENCKYTVSPRGIQLPAAKYDLCVSDYGKPRADDTFQRDHILIIESFAEFMGYYMADGYIMDDASTCCITTCGKVAFEEMEELLRNAFGCNLKTSYTYFDDENSTAEKAIHIELDKPLAKMMTDKFGSEPSTKKIPVELMFAPKDVIKSFLRAYFKLGGKEASAANKCLREQLTFMLSSVCISAQYKTCDDKENIISLSGNDSRVAEITDESVDDIKHNLRAVYEKYPKQCAEVTGHRKSKDLSYNELCELIDDYGIEELAPLENIFINDIESKDELNSGDEYVYDISVEDNESFLTAECIFVHNSRAGRHTAKMVNVPVTWETSCPAV